MKSRNRLKCLTGMIFCLLFPVALLTIHNTTGEVITPRNISLPSPEIKSKISLEESIYSRKSIRSFRDEDLTLKQVSQLLWSAGGKTIDGLTGPTRSYPSAGGIYPLNIYLVAGRVKGLVAGIYLYDWKNHSLLLLKSGDFRRDLARAAWGQNFIAQAPASIVITALYPKTATRYGRRGESRYVPMDVGHSGQNIHLQAQSLGLGTVVVGAFSDNKVKDVLGIRADTPLYIMPVGKP